VSDSTTKSPSLAIHTRTYIIGSKNHFLSVLSGSCQEKDALLLTEDPIA
jgi:hypothetical protein